MKHILIILIAIAVCLPVTAEATEKMDEKAMMKKWQEIATPGKMHKLLATRAGHWVTHSKMWMNPGAAPVESKGSASAKMILGGRYLKMVYKGEMMGMPFNGISTGAYDNHKKKFISTWIDNMGTGVLITEGTLSKDGKTITEIGDMDDPFTGMKMKFKIINTMVDKDHMTMEMYNIMPDGKSMKSMEMHYKRK